RDLPMPPGESAKVREIDGLVEIGLDLLGQHSGGCEQQRRDEESLHSYSESNTGNRRTLWLQPQRAVTYGIVARRPDRIPPQNGADRADHYPKPHQSQAQPCEPNQPLTPDRG